MRVEDLTTFEGECPIIVVFSAYMDIRIPLTKKWKKIINEKEDKPNTYHNNLIDYILEQIALSGFNMKSIGNLLIKKIVFNENNYYRYNNIGGFPATINDLGYWDRNRAELNEDFELYKVRVDDESESLIESLEDLQDAFKQGHYVCIEVGKLPYSIDLNYLRNLQELSAEAVEYLPGLKECSREEAFNIIREWAKEFTEKYGNYDFDGSYYDKIDEFIDKKLGTI